MSFSPTIYRVLDLPDDWRDRIRAMPVKSEILPDEVRSEGWVDLDMPAESADLSQGRWDLDGVRAGFCWCIDERRPNGKLVADLVSSAARNWCSQNDRETCPREVRSQLRDAIVSGILNRTAPKRTRIPVYFDSQASLLLVGTPSEKVADCIKRAWELDTGSKCRSTEDLELLLLHDVPEDARETARVALDLPRMPRFEESGPEESERLVDFLAWLFDGDAEGITVADRVTLGDEVGGQTTCRGGGLLATPEVNCGLAAGRQVQRIGLRAEREDSRSLLFTLGADLIPRQVNLNRWHKEEPDAHVLAILEYEALLTRVATALSAYLEIGGTIPRLRRQAVGRLVDQVAVWVRETGQAVLWEEAGAVACQVPGYAQADAREL